MSTFRRLGLCFTGFCQGLVRSTIPFKEVVRYYVTKFRVQQKSMIPNGHYHVAVSIIQIFHFFTSSHVLIGTVVVTFRLHIE